MKQNFILKKITVLIFVYFYSTILFAQENQNSLQKEAYSYEELKSELIKNNPQLLSLQEEYFRSTLDVKDAWWNLGPTVDLQLSGTYMTNPPVDAVYLNVDELLNSVNWPNGTKPNGQGEYVKVYDGMENTLYNIELSLMQPLFTWGKITNSIIKSLYY